MIKNCDGNFFIFVRKSYAFTEGEQKTTVNFSTVEKHVFPFLVIECRFLFYFVSSVLSTAFM